ncbi:formate dehydrogenase accessory sulfurtransferase FdhD [uncultured Pseudodesulfovibrio sp.]|uniref:formate dehydrogenase accessory sulfurtransferase FdhD n=1 Tax=uncultured Pseudodesulfovibrio sp. TaxID=2035858 RepID=UPI0029C6AE71|nr:formate dehydrogenase accessory sulfurtransferase FdhD [uncultured Pseudodesulfovibrio sp.]
MPSTQFSLIIPTLPSRESSCPAGPTQTLELMRGTSLEHYCAGTLQDRTAMVVVEESLQISIRGREDIFLARTPGDDENLIVGHLFSQGLIRTRSDILDMTFRHGSAQAVVGLRHHLPRRPLPAMSGVSNIDPKQIFRLRKRFEEHQRLYHSTGATHAAALFKANGELVAYGEDVSRHCAFDKAIGSALESRLLAGVEIAMLTSRLASELAAKASMARIPVLCGFSAATSSGMELAESDGVTLIGRIGKDSFTVYANGWRLRS